MIRENIYGHSKRLRWIVSYLKREDTIVELGCGTGAMVTLPLLKMGYTVYGLDLDGQSIHFGQELFRKEGLDPFNLMNLDISDLNLMSDVVIASEVLEHLEDQKLESALQAIRNKIKRGGLFLVTVPNGYGWFELESFLWHKTLLGQFLTRSRAAVAIHKLKSLILRKNVEHPHPATLSNSHHVQQFSYNFIQNLLKNNGFEVLEIKGSVLFSGPFSNLFFTGMKRIMKINCVLGEWFPKIASGFYVRCRPGLKELMK